MKKILTITVLIIILTNCAFCQPVPYISPGIGVSWNHNGQFLFTPKVSVGLYHERIFYNLTFAKAFSSELNMYPHYLIECQCGKLSEPMNFRKAQLFFGGGIGITIPENRKQSKPSLRASFFTGNLLFFNITLLFTETIQSEFGGQLVLPVPLRKVDLFEE